MTADSPAGLQRLKRWAANLRAENNSRASDADSMQGSQPTKEN